MNRGVPNNCSLSFSPLQVLHNNKHTCSLASIFLSPARRCLAASMSFSSPSHYKHVLVEQHTKINAPAAWRASFQALPASAQQQACPWHDPLVLRAACLLPHACSPLATPSSARSPVFCCSMNVQMCVCVVIAPHTACPPQHTSCRLPINVIINQILCLYISSHLTHSATAHSLRPSPSCSCQAPL